MEKFIVPTLEYLPSYLRALKIAEKEGFPDFVATSQEIEENPEEFIRKLNLLDSKECKKVKEWLLPSKLFWLVNTETKKFIGKVSIRYNVGTPYLASLGGHIGYMVSDKFRKKGYGSKLLKFGLEIAKGICLGEILIVCNENNIGSKKIIEKNGGKLINVIYDDSVKMNKFRYRIILNESAHELWKKFLIETKDLEIKKQEFGYICWQFGANPDELLSLVLMERKKACTSLYSSEYENIVTDGIYNVILNSHNKAICVTKNKSLKICDFENVSEEFAKKEGEGDLSLDHWRKAHEKFFQGDEKKNSLILEEFHLVYSI